MSVGGQRKGADHNRIKADNFAANLLPLIRELQANGVTSYRAIARELERRGIKTARGGYWFSTQVSNILRRTRARQSGMAQLRRSPGPPMTLGNLRQLGVRGLIVACLDANCRHETTLGVDDYADEVEVPSFAPRLVCSKCGGNRVDVRPNWKEMKVMPPRLHE